MADRSVTLSSVRIQALSHDLARAWAVLKAACGHSRPFFSDGLALLPTEHTTPVCPVLTGLVGVCHA